MMRTVLRTFFGFLAGFLAAFALVIGTEVLTNAIHPLPGGNTVTHEEVCLHVSKFPAWVLAIVIAAWGTTAWFGAFLSGRVGNIYASSLLAILLFAAVVLNISMLPYALWFKAAIILVIPVAAGMGAWRATSLTHQRAAQLTA